MRKQIYWLLTALLTCLALPQVLLAGNGYMGGGKVVVEDEADAGGQPASVTGPLNDKQSKAGSLYGDLYKILRYQGGELYTKFLFSYDEQKRITSVTVLPNTVSIGGEPVLSTLPGYYAIEVTVGDEVAYELATSPYPSQCAQPVADHTKWGDISGVTGLDFNRLPLVVTYDATWTRSECEVGELLDVSVDSTTGAIEFDINEFFVPPCSDVATYPEECTWNGVVYCDGVRWTDLVDEVHFGRLNLSRAPEAVLQAALDEAITSINAASSISRDPAGRLLLTTEIFDEFTTGIDVEGELVCMNAPIETVVKAIDSPRENLALYVKLLKDGHLVTPGNDRAPIDRSERGGIPVWKLLELSDGPSDALRPTVDIAKLGAVFGNLVDVAATEYYTYYECYDDNGIVCDCLCGDTKPDGEPTTVACENVAGRELVTVDVCPDIAITPNAATCEGPWIGIKSTDADSDGINDYLPQGADFDFAAAFLGAAADKTGEIGLDMIVYINSILGINKVVGYSEYDSEGDPVAGAVDYSRFPVYFDFSAVPTYDRNAAMGNRGDAGLVTVLQPGLGETTWEATPVDMLGTIAFRNWGRDIGTGTPTHTPAVQNIMGFAQMADDDLSVVEFIHRYQIPELR